MGNRIRLLVYGSDSSLAGGGAAAVYCYSSLTCMYSYRDYREYIGVIWGIMEKKMEATIMGLYMELKNAPPLVLLHREPTTTEIGGSPNPHLV